LPALAKFFDFLHTSFTFSIAFNQINPMAMARGGRIKTIKPSEHTMAKIEIIQSFLDINFDVTKESDNVLEIVISN